jgi:3-oxoadipate enol-lactonase
VVVLLPPGMPVDLLADLTSVLVPGHRVIFVEGRELSSESARFADDLGGVDDLGDDLALVLDHIGASSAHLIGNCTSAVSALRFAVRHPERVKTLILADGAYSIDGVRRTEYQGYFSKMVSEAAKSPARAALACERFLSTGDRGADPQVAHLTMLPFANQGLFYRFAVVSRALLSAHVSRWLPQVMAPTLVVAGSSDSVEHPEGSCSVARGIANSELYLEIGGGHLNLRKPSSELTSRLLEFYARWN